MTPDTGIPPQTKWTQLTYAVVYINRSGQTPPDAVEMSVVPIVGGTIGEPKTWLLCPDLSITTTATRMHGISNRDVVDAAPFARVEDEIRKTLDAEAFVSHGGLMDRNLLQRKLTGWSPSVVLSTMALARLYAPKHKGFHLETLADRFALAEDLPPGLNRRRAPYRALVTAALFVMLANKAGSFEELRRPSRPAAGGDRTPA